MKLKPSPFQRMAAVSQPLNATAAAHVTTLAPTVNCKEKPADRGGFVGTELCAWKPCWVLVAEDPPLTTVIRPPPSHTVQAGTKRY
jgi:hypothetical protein